MKKFLVVLSSVVTVVAVICASTASLFTFYQPRTPKCLR